MAGRQQTYIQRADEMHRNGQSGRTATEAESRRSDERRPDEHVQKEEGPDQTDAQTDFVRHNRAGESITVGKI